MNLKHLFQNGSKTDHSICKPNFLTLLLSKVIERETHEQYGATI